MRSMIHEVYNRRTQFAQHPKPKTQGNECTSKYRLVQQLIPALLDWLEPLSGWAVGSAGSNCSSCANPQKNEQSGSFRCLCISSRWVSMHLARVNQVRWRCSSMHVYHPPSPLSKFSCHRTLVASLAELCVCPSLVLREVVDKQRQKC
jgi:hypothetical protein